MRVELESVAKRIKGAGVLGAYVKLPTVSNYTKLFIMTTVASPDPPSPPPHTLDNRSSVWQHFVMCKNLIKSELFICIHAVWVLNTNKNSST